MKTNLIQALRLTLVSFVVLVCVYSAIIWGIAQFAPNHGKGKITSQNGKNYFANIGQKFTDDKYFWSRPSATTYNAAGSAGSNKGPNNPEYLAEVKVRIDTFLIHNPAVQKSEIPVDLITASGSGIDPNISIQAALVQIPRIAKIRGITSKSLELLVEQQTEKTLFSLFGPEKINVLKLNLSLDQIKNK